MGSFAKAYDTRVRDSIDKWGRPTLIVWGSTANCSSCAYDPITKEATNSACDTCNGTYFFQIENNKTIKAAFKSFVGNMQFADYALHKFGYVPKSDARLTFLLEDVLLNLDSATGDTYFDKSIRIVVDGKNYEVENLQRTGLEDLKVGVVTLKEKK